MPAPVSRLKRRSVQTYGMDIEFERFLEDISASFLVGDLDRWRARLILPFSLITKLKPIVLTTEDAV